MTGKNASTALWDSLSPDLIGIQVEGRIAYINTAGARLLGAASSDQVIGRPILDFIHPDCRQTAVERPRQLSAQESEVLSGEEQWVRLDGAIIDVRVAATPLTFEGKPAIQFIARQIDRRP